MTRRESVFALAATVIAGPTEAQSDPPVRKLNVVCVGGHPDDPESGCGGTLARYSAAGHNVTIVYLTRGEAGIQGRTHEDAARIRTEEAQKACKVLGAQPVFAGQIDGSTEIDPAAYRAFQSLLESQHPDIVFTHWPVDTHPDHCAASLLTYQAWLRGKKKYALVYFEVMTGEQTQEFKPDLYVDVADTWQKKKEACYLHASQQPPEFYGYHEQMERFRGLEHRCQRAEAFIVHSQGPPPPLAW
jgi:LmbE family N-acetylglucosaminyl deacetylase